MRPLRDTDLLQPPRRTATVTTTAPMRAIVMSGRGFRTMLADFPQVASQVRAVMDERLRRSP